MDSVKNLRVKISIGLVFILVSCTSVKALAPTLEPTLVAASPSATPTKTIIATQEVEYVQISTETPQPIVGEIEVPTATALQESFLLSPTPDIRPLPREWAGWPIIPAVSETAKEIYRNGIEKGANPHVVSVIGDCQSEPDVFMGIYETERNPLSAGESQLLETISRFSGSLSHKSLGVRDGMSAPTALSPLWSDKEYCEDNESPLTCELRVSRPSIVFVNLGTNWKAGASAERYGEYLRQIIEEIVEFGAVPILSTKADNVEGDHSINHVTAEVAYEYDVPLWNFWLAADDLPNHGLDADRGNIYLTPLGWDRRNYTAIKTLDAVWRALETE